MAFDQRDVVLAAERLTARGEAIDVARVISELHRYGLSGDVDRVRVELESLVEDGTLERVGPTGNMDRGTGADQIYRLEVANEDDEDDEDDD